MGRYAHASAHVRARAHVWRPVKKIASERKIFDLWLCQSNIND